MSTNVRYEFPIRKGGQIISVILPQDLNKEDVENIAHWLNGLVERNTECVLCLLEEHELTDKRLTIARVRALLVSKLCRSLKGGVGLLCEPHEAELLAPPVHG